MQYHVLIGRVITAPACTCALIRENDMFKISSIPNRVHEVPQHEYRACEPTSLPLQWRHNERDGVSNHQPHDCLLNRLFRRRSKKTAKLCATGLCAGNSPVTGEFPAQRPVTRKMLFPFDDVIMCAKCHHFSCGNTSPSLWPSDTNWRHRAGSTLAQLVNWPHQDITWTNVD